MGKIRIVYVWEVPVRVTHWVNALAITALSVTGLFIGAPMTVALQATDYVMGWVRFIHFVAGYLFAVSVLSRVYWSFVGNEYASWRTFFPFLTAAGRRTMWETFSFYVFMKRRPPVVVGHNPMANAFYLPLFGLFLIELATGFALYSQGTHNPVVRLMFGRLATLIPSQWIREVHHLVMWLLIGFTIQHVYSSWLMDAKGRGGLVSGIFSGYKSIEEKE